MWECLIDDYRYIRKGQKFYPTDVTENYIFFYIEGNGQIMYRKVNFRKVNFRECIIDYDPTQMGDCDDDI